jgi:hypothetical protein
MLWPPSSVSLTLNSTLHGRNDYYPYGGNRGGAAFNPLTTRRFTGQYHEKDLPDAERLSYSLTLRRGLGWKGSWCKLTA